ncbi:MAG: hypothetical protein R6U85_12375 [Salinivirgaceae bacterium]
MRKISFMLVALFLGLTAMAQPVVDNAIIPVSVNLNSILRLNVTSGGNIEFTVSNIDQYTGGIVNSDNYDTKFTVASSVDFNVIMYAEDGFTGTDDGTHAFPVGNVGYILESTGSGDANSVNYDFINDAGDGTFSDMTALSDVSGTTIITGISGESAGNTTKNAFTINWELATPAVDGANGGLGTLLSQSIPPDRYTTNVFLVLESQ